MLTFHTLSDNKHLHIDSLEITIRVDREGLTEHKIISMTHKQRNNMRKLLTHIFLLSVIQVAVGQHSATSKLDCSKNQYWDGDGLCCDKCPPGYKLIKKCSEGVGSMCEKCMEGTYQNKMNYYPNCFRCQKCFKDHAVEISSCTPQSNTVCECQPGYRKIFLNSITWKCVRSKRSSQLLFQNSADTNNLK